MGDREDAQLINAHPTKTFFVEMLVRDIPLEQAVLDLVDNSIDGAKRIAGAAEERLDGRSVIIECGRERFRIKDNCGGFDKATARDYAFRFGRTAQTPQTPHSIGQFGVGMKRALFKFGRHFIVRSATTGEHWSIDIDVDQWEDNDANWHFPWADLPVSDELSESSPGTEIIVDRLRPEVAARFGTEQFINSIRGLIKSKHRQFLARGLSISVNGGHLTATDLLLLVGSDLKPGVSSFNYTEGSETSADNVAIRITVGLGDSSPREAGWYIVCNGRVIIESDRRPLTGWGLVEEAGRGIPSYHNQFARFRGIALFDSPNSSRVPWNTTKDDVVPDSPVWQFAFQRMTELMRPVIDFLNELDKDIDEYTREKSPLMDRVSKAAPTRVDGLGSSSSFVAPKRGSIPVRSVKIQYSRPIADVEFLQEALEVGSAKAVGEKTFDLTLRKQRGE